MFLAGRGVGPRLGIPRLSWPTRGTHPRPQLQRDRWRSLDGLWQLAYDDDARWAEPGQVTFDRVIRVPYPPESIASGM